MASTGSLEDLCKETTCPLCGEHFQDPVTIDCGHSFCHICLIQYLGESDAGISRPRCRKTFQLRRFRTRQQREKDAEKGPCRSSYDKKLESPENDRKWDGTEGGKGLCDKHQKPLEFFCEDGQAPLCCICYNSGNHDGHILALVAEEADGLQLTQPASSEKETMVVPCATMSLSPPSASVEEVLMCPICREDLADPVSVDCGHDFCQRCITEHCERWQQMNVPLQCPSCKAQIWKGNLWPSWQLKNVIEKVMQLSLKPTKENLCLKHKKELSRFCVKDAELVCIGCERSPEHISHEVVLLEQAA